MNCAPAGGVSTGAAGFCAPGFDELDTTGLAPPACGPVVCTGPNASRLSLAGRASPPQETRPTAIANIIKAATNFIRMPPMVGGHCSRFGNRNITTACNGLQWATLDNIWTVVPSLIILLLTSS